MKIAIASSSPLKRQALETQLGRMHDFRVELLSVDLDFGGLTITPQPIGQAQALECCRQRIEIALGHPELVQVDAIVAIENFIEFHQKNGWIDTCMVVIQHKLAGKLLTVAEKQYWVPIPREYCPEQSDIAFLPETIGERIHRDMPEIPANDWYSAFGANPRHVMIGSVLNKAFKRCFGIAALLSKHPMREYANFPEIGVRFTDLFSMTTIPKFNTVLIDGLKARVEFQRQCEPKQSIAIVGLESRGLMLAYALACVCGLPFIPARKPGKLPGHVESISYEKEYGSDIFEMQSEYLQTITHVVVVDDVIATGGSVLAVCKLVEKLGMTVALVLAISDIPCLRERWKTCLASIPVNLMSW